MQIWSEYNIYTLLVKTIQHVFSDNIYYIWLHLSSNPRGIFAKNAAKNYRPEKFPFIATNNWIVLTVWRSLNCFFTVNSPKFPKSLVEEKETGTSKELCFRSKSNYGFIPKFNSSNNAQNFLLLIANIFFKIIFTSYESKIYELSLQKKWSLQLCNTAE